MKKQRKESLEAVLQLCGNLGAEIRYHPEYRYFTAMVWTGWDIWVKHTSLYVLRENI